LILLDGWPNYLQAAQVDIITNSECSQTGIAKLGFSIANQHICAGRAGAAQKSSCEVNKLLFYYLAINI
jgi:hypothetical protein